MRRVARNPLLLITLGVAAVGGILWLVGLPAAVGWLYGGFAIRVAGVELVGMIRRLRRGAFGIDVLAVIAIVSTVAVGEYLAALIIVLMLAGGHALENYAEGRARRELTSLLDREPRVARRITPDGGTEEVAADSVAIGDRLLVRSGDVVPVDGILLSGSAAFDESTITGESLPVEHATGERILSGSVTGLAAATIEATSLARDSQYQQIVALVKNAAAERAPVVRLADRFAVPFTVLSLLIAGIAWAVSGDPTRFAEVLVLATPCPLLLATPVAFLGGMSRAAHHGIIVKNGGILELLARARTVAFDKTGTLTEGRPRLVAIHSVSGDDTALLRLAATAEQSSSHVFATSIVTEARNRGLELPAVHASREAAAEGISATVGDLAVDVGSFAFVARRDAATPRAEIGAGEAVIYVAVDGAFAGTLVAADQVRPGAAETVAELRRLGIEEIVMVTGDARETAEDIARRVGVTRVHADCLPGDKVAILRGLERRPVVMIGDGVNDSPALAAAEVGIAMGARGATAASEAAGAVFLLDHLDSVVPAVLIGRRTVRVALQSIGLGIALSLGLMLVATTGVIPATVGAGLQELVDVATILNALRALGGDRPRARTTPEVAGPTALPSGPPPAG